MEEGVSSQEEVVVSGDYSKVYCGRKLIVYDLKNKITTVSRKIYPNVE